MDINNQERFIKRFITEYFSAKRRIATNRFLFKIVAGIILLNIWNFLIMHPSNVKSTIKDHSSFVR
ncbi:MAG: hypothetical protein RLZZ171_2769 [Cyanobacteriota bacterium]|jgi:hypothetical protein